MGLLAILIVGLAVPQNLEMPVLGASHHDYNPQSFWYYPWGKSVTHKGIDIFAKQGTDVVSSTNGWVLYAGETSSLGGNTVLVLGPKWRLHYYAHLDEIECSTFETLSRRRTIGTVGTTGNAKGKPPHLHYSIVTLLPYPWRIDGAKLGWMKMFFLNPIDYLK